MANPLTKYLEKIYFINIEGMGLSQLKISSDGNPTFMIGDPMKKVHTGNNKSSANLASTIYFVHSMVLELRSARCNVEW